MSKNLKQHGEQKNLLLNQYDKILNSERLLSFDVKRDDIEERIQNLSNEKFIVSICGQMNSGKSTLLNSYIFGDLVLPFYDTTQTAKLTIINYSDSPYFEPVFYDQNEWEQVTSSFKNDEEFKESLNLADEAGINLNKIFDKRKTEKINDLKKLTDYVAIPVNGGIYSPFVNYVNLYYPNEILKEVTVVDTPGINDPNQLRERITLDWVKKSDAVLYVTYAKGAFTEDDYNFIQKNLIHIPRENMIIAVNKSDTVEDINSIGQWLDTLSDNDKFLKGKIFDKQTPRVFVSSLGELIRKMTENGIDLTEDLKYYFDAFKKGIDFTQSDNNNIEKLGKVIEEKLVRDKGSKLIKSHKEFVESLFKRIIQSIDLQLSTNRMKQEDYSKDTEELQNELDNLQKQSEKIDRKLIDLDSKGRKLSYNLSNEQEKDVIKTKTAIVEDIENKLNSLEYIDLFYDQVPWILKSSFENHVGLLERSFEKLTNSYNEEVEKEIEEFVDELSQYQLFSKDFIRSSFNLSTYEVCRDFRETVDNYLSREVVEEMIASVTSRWSRFWNTEKGRKQSVGFFKNESNDIVTKIIDSIRKRSIDEISEHVKRVFEELNAKAKSLIRERNNSKRDILKNQSDKANSLMTLKEEEQSLIQTKNEIVLNEKEIIS